MSAATGRAIVEGNIRRLRADADVNEVEARRLRADADRTDERAAEGRRLADELEELLPAEVVE